MQGVQSDWRRAADPEDLREYDRFGPWIDRVTEPVDMPRRFRPWWPELSGAAHLLKVPRDYDRSQVRPGMDLYQAVIGIFPDGLVYLRAAGDQVHRRDVGLAGVVATRRHSNLLVGGWSLLLADGSALDIDFNTVSMPTIALVDRYLLANRSDEPVAAVPAGVVPGEHLFLSIAAELNAARDAPVHPIHVEESGRLCRNQRGRRRRSFGIMVLASPDDLVIVNRDLAAQPLFRRANYASNIITVPFRRMTSFAIVAPEPTTPPGFHTLAITCDRQVVTQLCLDRPAEVAALLAARGVPEA
jgi:hypothetical protein